MIEAIRLSETAARQAGIGPAHPCHPDHLAYYTEDHIARDTPRAEELILIWAGYGQDAEVQVAEKRPAPVEVSV